MAINLTKNERDSFVMKYKLNKQMKCSTEYIYCINTVTQYINSHFSAILFKCTYLCNGVLENRLL